MNTMQQMPFKNCAPDGVSGDFKTEGFQCEHFEALPIFIWTPCSKLTFQKGPWDCLTALQSSSADVERNEHS